MLLKSSCSLVLMEAESRPLYHSSHSISPNSSRSPESSRYLLSGSSKPNTPNFHFDDTYETSALIRAAKEGYNTFVILILVFRIPFFDIAHLVLMFSLTTGSEMKLFHFLQLQIPRKEIRMVLLNFGFLFSCIWIWNLTLS